MRAARLAPLLVAACTTETLLPIDEDAGKRLATSEVEAQPRWQGIYGQSSTELFRIDPETYDVTRVGAFHGCHNVLDIAVDGAERIVGVSHRRLYSIDPNSAKCTEIARGIFPNSLAFVPAGTVDEHEEALVGYDDDRYVRIDSRTGRLTILGGLDAPGLESSGDLVSVRGGKTFLTVKGTGCDTDCLVEVDPKRGVITKNWGVLGYREVYGIAFWAGHVYGFSAAGFFFEVTFEGDRATARPVAPPSDHAFWGAGSTTIAPLRAVGDGPPAVLAGDVPP